MPALSEAQLAELTRRNHTRVLNVRSQVEARVGSLWDRLRPIGDAEAKRFAEQAAALVTAGQSGVSVATAGYLKTATGDTGPSAPLAGAALRNGAAPIDVYMRSVITTRSALSQGKAVAEALKIGRDRATSTAETDIMLAQRAQVDAWVQGNRIVGYRRVLTGVSCVLCATASTQRYHQGDLMPIHQRCDCGIAPIIGDKDPGHVINTPVLTKLQKLGPQYWHANGLVDNEGNFILGGTTPPPSGPTPAPRGSGTPGTPHTPPALKPVPGTDKPDTYVSWASPKAEKEFGPTFDRLADLHGVPPSTLDKTIVEYGGRSQAKGGHFSWGAPKVIKPRRTAGMDPVTYRAKMQAYYAARSAGAGQFETRIRVNDRGEGSMLNTLLHEFGHRLDFTRDNGVARLKTRSAASATPEVYAFLQAARATPTIAEAGRRYVRNPSFVSYYRDPGEVWARAYSQWAAVKLGGPEREALRALQSASPGYQWPDVEFESVLPHVENVLRVWGMLR